MRAIHRRDCIRRRFGQASSISDAGKGARGEEAVESAEETEFASLFASLPVTSGKAWDEPVTDPYNPLTYLWVFGWPNPIE